MATRTLLEAESALRKGGLTGKSLDMALTTLRNQYSGSSVTPPTATSSGRDLSFSSSNPASSLAQSGAASAGVAGAADPYTSFNNQLMQMLTRQQSMGTKRFAEQGFNAQKAQNDRVLKKTDSSLIGADPGLQNSVRSASASSLNPTINQASQAQQTFSEQIGGFKDAITSAKDLLATYQAQDDKKRDDARSVIKDALTLGGADSLNGLAPEELKQLEKLAGYPAGYVQGLTETIKERELQLKQEQAEQKALLAGAVAQTKVDAKQAAKDELIGLLNQYRSILKSSNAFTRFLNPSTVASMESLKGQITAVYKKQQQLGTLDAGVQKLVDSIIPGQGISPSQLDTSSQVTALDNFILNQGGTPGGEEVTASSSTPAVGDYQAYLRSIGLAQ